MVFISHVSLYSVLPSSKPVQAQLQTTADWHATAEQPWRTVPSAQLSVLGKVQVNWLKLTIHRESRKSLVAFWICAVVYSRSGTDLISLLILFLFLLRRPLQESLRLRRFKSDRDEIWKDSSSSEYALIGRVVFLIWCVPYFRVAILCRTVTINNTHSVMNHDQLLHVCSPNRLLIILKLPFFS